MGKALRVVCGDGSMLDLLEVQPPGKKVGKHLSRFAFIRDTHAYSRLRIKSDEFGSTNSPLPIQGLTRSLFQLQVMDGKSFANGLRGRELRWCPQAPPAAS